MKVGISMVVLGYIGFGGCFGSVVIQEVSFAGTNEWVYMQNDSYSGTLEIHGIKNDPISVTLSEATDLIIGDAETNISGYTGEYFGTMGISLLDSKVWGISVYASGLLIDEFNPTVEDILETKKEGINLTALYIEEGPITDSGIDTNTNIISTSLLQELGIEIHSIKPHDSDEGGEYIELLANQYFSGTIEIQGLGQSSASKYIDLEVFTGDIVLITDSPDDYPDSIGISSISLTDSGEGLTIVGQDGQLIDSIVYKSSTKGSILTYIGDLGDERLFGNTEEETSSLFYESHGCAIVIQNKKPLFAGDSINFIAGNKGNELRNGSSSYHCERTGIKHAESTKCNPVGFSIEEEGIHMVTLKVYEGDQLCETRTSVNVPAKTILADPVKIDEVKCEETFNKKEEISDTKEGEGEGEMTSESRQFEHTSSILTGVITIESLLPNPDGADAGKEGLVLHNHGLEEIDTSGLIVHSGKRSKKIEDYVIASGSSKTILGDFGLYNSESCIRLINETGSVYDSVCYPESKNDVWYSLPSKVVPLESALLQAEEEKEAMGQGGNEAMSDGEEAIGQGDNKSMSDEDSIYTGQVYSGEVLASKEILFDSGVFAIDGILPNPVGKDGELESIRVKLLGEDTEDELIQGLVINTGKGKTALGEDFNEIDSVFIRTGKLGLYNSPRCVRLESTSGIIYDEFCYPKPDDGARYSHSLSIDTGMNSDWMASLAIDFQETSVCITSEKESLLCKENPLLSYKVKLEKEIIKRKKDAGKNEESEDGLKTTIYDQKELNTLHKEVIYDVAGILEEEHPDIYESSGIKKLYQSRKGNNSISTDNNSETQKLPMYSKSQQYLISMGEFPLDELPIDETIQATTVVTKEFISGFLENLKTQKSQ